MFHKYHRNITIRIYDSFFSTFTTNVILFILPLYLSMQFGSFLAGFMLLTSLIIGMISGMYAGHYTDRYGRKRFIQVAEAIRCFCILVMAYFNSPWAHSTVVTYVFTILFSVCSGITAPATDAMIMDVSTEEQRKEIYNLLYWVRNIGYALSSLTGGFLLKTHIFSLFCVILVTSLITNVLVASLKDVYQSQAQTAAKEESLFTNYRNVFHDKKFMLYLLAAFFAFGLESQLNNYIGVHFAKTFPVQSLMGLKVDGIQMLGMLGAENTILVILLATAIGKFVRGHKDQWIIPIGVMLYACGLAVLVDVKHAWVLLFTMMIVTVGEIMAYPTMMSLITTLAPEHARASYSAVINIVIQAAVGFCSLCITIGSVLSSTMMALLFIAMGILSTVCLLGAVRPSLSSSNVFRTMIGNEK